MKSRQMHQIRSKPCGSRLSCFEIPNSSKSEFRSFDPKKNSDRKTLKSRQQIGIVNHLIFGIIKIGSLSSENKPLQISIMDQTSLLAVWTEFRSFDPQNDSDRKTLYLA